MNVPTAIKIMGPSALVSSPSPWIPAHNLESFKFGSPVLKSFTIKSSKGKNQNYL